MTLFTGTDGQGSFKDFAILIPTRNRPAILRRTLHELKLAGFGSKSLFVYDDASQDQEAVARVVNEAWPHASFFAGKERQGQAAGRNALLRECPCELALCLDDDSFPESGDWTEAYVRMDWQARRWAAVTFQYRRLSDGGLSIIGPTVPCSAKSFLGGASMVHVPSVLSVGGYRSCFIYRYEEPELSLRLRLAGFRIWQEPRVVILHNQFHTPDENRDYREYDYLSSRNGVLLSSLNLPLPIGLGRGIARSLKHLLITRRNRRASIRGLVDGISLTFTLWHERQPCAWGTSIDILRERI